MSFCLAEVLAYNVYMQGNILRVVGPIYPNLARSGKDLKFDCSRLGLRPFEAMHRRLAYRRGRWAPRLAAREAENCCMSFGAFPCQLELRLAVRLVA